MSGGALPLSFPADPRRVALASRVMKCGQCGYDNPDGMRFCGACGSALEAPPPPSVDVSGPVSTERRQVTVLFCDLVGSTRLSDRLDPVDLRAIVRAYQAAVSDVVERYEGHIAQYQGDGVLVYFGYPRALEDAARRAVLAAREIVAAVKKQSADLEAARGITIAVRVGVHTGEGVTGALGGPHRHEQLLIGSAPTIAARLQGLAKPNEVVVGQTTRKLVDAHFEVAKIAASEPAAAAPGVEAFAILGERGRTGRLSAVRSLGKLIGRGDEIDRLLSLFEQSREGRGHAVLVSGEAGLGKSRLLHSIEARVPAAFAVLGGQCSLYAQNTALYPLVDPFERLFGIQGEKGAEERRAAVFERLDALGLGSDDVRARLASFLGLAAPESQPSSRLSPQKQLEALFEALLSVLLRRADREPVVLAIEDLHWADPTTLRFLDQVVAGAAGARVLLVCTTRPGFDPSWPAAPHVARIDLRRLPPDEIAAIVNDRAGKPLPAVIVQQIVQRADGVPLFAEELTRAVLEGGMVVLSGDRYELARPFDAPEVPASLRDSLMARLDRFGRAKEVAQIASAIGRFVPWPLLAEVAPMDRGALRAELDRLVEAEVLSLDVSGEDEVFVFKHALIQDVAHDSMLRARRRDVHERIARAITERFPAQADEHPELVARHFEEAGKIDEATGHIVRAGQRALGRAAPIEAMSLLSHGIELLADRPEDVTRWVRELQLRAVLLGALTSTRGYAAPEVEEQLTRARELCGFLGDPPEVFMVVYGLWVMHAARGDARGAERYAGEIMKVVVPGVRPEIEVSARMAYANTLLYLARYDDAIEQYTRIAEVYTPALHGPLVQAFGDDHGPYAACYEMMAQLFLGRFDRAREVMARAKQMSDTLADPLTRTIVVAHEILLRFFEGDQDAVLSVSSLALSLSAEFGYHLWHSIGQLGHGWYRAVHGDHGGVDEMREGLAFWERLNQRVPITLWTGYLTNGLFALGRHDEALQAIDRTLADSAGTLDQLFEPELMRLRGEILAARDGDHAGAVAQLRRAIERAREQKAGALELRAAVSLGELCARRGDLGSAREALEAALARVTGAGDIPEYRRGKALLLQS